MEFINNNSKFNLLVFVLLIFCFTKGQCKSKVFRLEDYGAVKGGQVDNREAVLKAWGDACKWKGRSKLVISLGTYFLSPVTLSGPCNGPIEFQNSGILKAPVDLKGNFWFAFHHIDRLTLSGGGSFDGQIPPKQGGPNLPTLLSFVFVTNSQAKDVKLMNSQSTHFSLFGCNNVDLTRISVLSPEDSPNTDGIKIGNSNGITISNSFIASGDDCVAIINGSKNITVASVNCGPGHGISIGSIGTTPNEHVDHVLVSNCSLSGTMNGLRIKTKATNLPGFVSNVQYQDIIFNNVDNAIIFDQNYCPSGSCRKSTSRVQISNVKFRNIYGTSKTAIAVNLQCSRSNPCNKIELRNIQIKSQGNTISKCSYANGRAYGKQLPKPCLSY